MDKQQILDLLKAVTYPGFTRDIVSFGIVNDVLIDGDAVTIHLRITTQKEDKKKIIIDEVQKIVEGTDAFKKVNVKLVDPIPEKASTPQPSSSAPHQITQAEPLKDVTHVIAVASGKGGVGKSTVAANLALVLKDQGHKVGLLDLDIYGPSLPIILGFNEQPRLTAERKLVPIERYGLKVMSFGLISGNDTPVIWRGPLVARMTEQFFQDVEWGKLDYLILDLPPGTGDVQLTLTQKLRISGAVIVTTPQDIALADVRKGADMFRKVQTPVLGVIENMSGLQIEGQIVDEKGHGLVNARIKVDGSEPLRVDEGGKFTIRLDLFKRGGGLEESRRLGVPLLGEIPFSKDIMEATDSGMPVVLKAPASSVSGIYRDIVDKITAILQ